MPGKIIAEIRNNRFPTVAVPPDTYVIWRNLDPHPHTSRRTPTAAILSNVGPLFSGGESSPVYFGRAASVDYVCPSHANMTGRVVVDANATLPPGGIGLAGRARTRRDPWPPPQALSRLRHRWTHPAAPLHVAHAGHRRRAPPLPGHNPGELRRAEACRRLRRDPQWVVCRRRHTDFPPHRTGTSPPQALEPGPGPPRRERPADARGAGRRGHRPRGAERFRVERSRRCCAGVLPN